MVRMIYDGFRLSHPEPCLAIALIPNPGSERWRPPFHGEMEAWCSEHLQPGWRIFPCFGFIIGRIDTTHEGDWEEMNWNRLLLGIEFATEEDKVLFLLRWKEVMDL